MKKGKEPKLIREENIGKASLKIIRGDISRVGGGVIMSPTNDAMSRNSGLTSYIIEAAGNRVFLEMNNAKRELESFEPGDIVVTGAGNLPAIHLFHTCMPPYNRDDPEPCVRMFVLKVLEKTEELKAESVILPCLPKDVYGYTPEHCAFGYFSSVIDYVNSHPETGIKEVKFVLLDKSATKRFEKEADRRFGVKPKKSFFSFGKKKKSKGEQNVIELR